MTGTCNRVMLTQAPGGHTFEPCGKPTTWLVRLNDKAWPLCEYHREFLRSQYAEHPRYSEQEITE